MTGRTSRSRRSLRLLLLIVATSFAGPLVPAAAHDVDPSVLTVVDSISPELEGVTIDVITTVSTQLVATNTTREVLEVVADTGEPFLRIGPDGVEANLGSPTWYLTNSPFGTATVPSGVRADGEARWARVSIEHTWGWFDHRLHPAEIRSVLGGDDAPRFTIPMRLGSTDLEVRGHLEQRTSRVIHGSSFERLPSADTGLIVQLLQGRAPGVLLQWRGAGEVLVEGADGEPFARLSPVGAEVNRRSRTWQFSAQAEGRDLTGVDVDPTAAPDWFLVSATPSLAWLEERALIVDDVAVQRWEIPLAIGSTRSAITGRSTADIVSVDLEASTTEDPSGGGPPVVIVVAAAAVTVGAVVALLLRRRPTGPS